MEELLNHPQFIKVAKAIAKTVRFLAQRGWSPATSSNFSVRLPHQPQLIAISKSGKDKFDFCGDDVMIVDLNGKVVAPHDAQPSAETRLHTLLYEDDQVGAVLHTHSMPATVLSMTPDCNLLTLTGFELLKGLCRNTSHEGIEKVPIFTNNQDMEALANEVRAYMKEHESIHGFLIKGHGLYSWGSDLAQARQHIETFEFLFDCKLAIERRR